MENNEKISMIDEKAKRERRIKNTTFIVRLCALLIAAGFYMHYAIKNMNEFKWYHYLVSFAAIAGFTAVLIIAMPKLVRALLGESEALIGRPKNYKKTFWMICLAALILHVVTTLAGILIFKLCDPSMKNAANVGFFDIWQTAFTKGNTDAGHYMNIAENWYMSEGHDRLLIVFFPMLPVLIRAFNVITGNSFVSAQIINAIATCLASGMVYLTLQPIIGNGRSKAAAFIALLLPGAIFMNSPMSEPLFLLFTVTAFYFIQKRSFLLAGVFTALAGFTRSLGVIMAVPLAIEGICYIVGLAKSGKKWGAQLGVLAAALVVSTLGTLGYLLINYIVAGDCLKFLEYQLSNWHQKATPFFDTPRYMINYWISYVPNDMESVYSLWLPSFVAIFGSLAIMLASAKRLPATYTVHFLAYFFVAIGCSWLLSSVRYLSAELPLVAAVALACNKKWSAAIVFTLLIIGYIAYMVMYMLRWGIY